MLAKDKKMSILLSLIKERLRHLEQCFEKEKSNLDIEYIHSMLKATLQTIERYFN